LKLSATPVRGAAAEALAQALDTPFASNVEFSSRFSQNQKGNTPQERTIHETGWHTILPCSNMMKDILSILLAFVLGYGFFLTSFYFLAQWTLKIKKKEEFTFSGPDEVMVHWTVKAGRRIASHNRIPLKGFFRIASKNIA